MLVVQVDNYLYSGTTEEHSRFESFLHSYFKIGTLERKSFSVLGCELDQSSDGSISLTQLARSTHINTDALDVATKGRSENDRLASPPEIRSFRSVIGKCLYVGRLTNPVLLYHCSSLASKVPNLSVRHMKTLRTIVNMHTKNPQTVMFLHSTANQGFCLQAMSDASMNTSTEAARGGFVIFRRAGDIIHPICWSARKLRRVARSSSTAELLAASDAANMLAYIQILLGELLYHHPAEITFDSRSLFDLATTVHEPLEPMNKVDLAAIRQLFRPNGINAISWSPGHYNATDALTKNNATTAALLLKVLREGIYAFHPDRVVRMAEQPMHSDASVSDRTGVCWTECIEETHSA